MNLGKQKRLALIIDRLIDKQYIQQRLLAQLAYSAFKEVNMNLNITEHTYKVIKRGYNKAVKNNEESFEVIIPEGKIKLVTGYAKYMLQYIDSIRKR